MRELAEAGLPAEVLNLSTRVGSEVAGSYGAPLTLGKVTAYQLADLKDGTVYYLALTAYDTSNNESAYSVEVSADTGDQLAPGPPQGMKAKRPIPAVHVSSPGL